VAAEGDVVDRIAPPDADARTEVNGQRRVLVIDDEALIRKTVRLACEQEGYAVEEAETGTQALTALESFRPDIILLDLMLPDISGFDICRDIRRTGSKVPILILSAKTEEIDVVVGLEIGADDYIVKPFRPRELLARIAAHLRKARQDEERGDDGRMVFRDLVIDVNERRVFRAGSTC
jgi:DNA-binding response OmpR family regulator